MQIARRAGQRLGTGAMLELHVVAAMRAVNIVVLYEPPAERTAVAMPCLPDEERCGHAYHQKSDDCLPHEVFSLLDYNIGTTGQYAALKIA